MEIYHINRTSKIHKQDVQNLKENMNALLSLLGNSYVEDTFRIDLVISVDVLVGDFDSPSVFDSFLFFDIHQRLML